MHIDGLDMGQLRLVEAIMASGSLSAAAEQVGLSQSAASHALARLRKRTGDALFVRTASRMQPTAYGQRLGAAAQRALEILRDGLRDVRSFDPSASRRVFTLSMSEAGQLVLLPALLAHLRSTAPHVGIQVQRVPDKAPGAQLESGEVDLAIGHITTLVTGFHRRRMMREHYVCVACERNPRFQAGMSRAAFEQSPHAIADASGMAHWMVDQQLEQHGIRRECGLVVPEFLALPFLLPGSPFIATMPSRVAYRYAEFLPLRIMPLPIASEPYEIFVFWHERSHADAANKWLRNVLVALQSTAADVA